MNVAIYGLFAGVLLAQTTSFEVASVKASNPNAIGSNSDSDPGRITMRKVTLKRCIQRAYEVSDIQITAARNGSTKIDTTSKRMLVIPPDTTKSTKCSSIFWRIVFASHFTMKPVR